MEHIGPSTIEREDWEDYYEGRIKELKAVNKEMLSALEGLVRDVECYCVPELGPTGTCWIHSAEEAIRKAKGEL